MRCWICELCNRARMKTVLRQERTEKTERKGTLSLRSPFPPVQTPVLPARMFSAPRNQASCFSTILSLCLLLGSGCRVVDETARLPGKAVAAIVPVSKSGQPDPAMLQVELQRYADEFAARTVAALEAYARDAGTPQARSESLQWKASVASAVVNIASGPNPTANLLDFLNARGAFDSVRPRAIVAALARNQPLSGNRSLAVSRGHIHTRPTGGTAGQHTQMVGLSNRGAQRLFRASTAVLFSNPGDRPDIRQAGQHLCPGWTGSHVRSRSRRA